MNNKIDHSSLKNISTLAELCRKVPVMAHLLNEWHLTRNRDLPPYGVTLTPDSVTPTDSRQVWWQCKKGHAWTESVVNRVYGILNGTDKGCLFCTPEKIEREAILYDYCTNPVPAGEVDCSHLLDEWDYEKNYPLTPKDVKTIEYRKVWWKCKNGHSWQQLISNRVKAGVGCPYCGHRRVLPGFNDLQTLYPEIAKEWDEEKSGTTPDKIFPMTARKAWWICPEGHSYQKIVSNRTQQGQGCPVCRALAGEKGSMLIPGVNDLATTNPELAAEWNYERNGDLKPSDVKAGSRNIVWWKCKNGHEWQTPVARRTGKRKIGCPGCSGLSCYQKYEDMGCTPRFEHFHQGQKHVWRGQELKVRMRKELRESGYDFQVLWKLIEQYQGETFHTMKGLEFHYTIKGGEMFVDHKEKSITESTLRIALKKALEIKTLSSPKQLGVFGASYLYGIFLDFGVIEAAPKK